MYIDYINKYIIEYNIECPFGTLERLCSLREQWLDIFESIDKIIFPLSEGYREQD